MNYVAISRDIWNDPDFRNDEPMSEREAWIWLECRSASGEFCISSNDATRQIGWQFARLTDTLFAWEALGLIGDVSKDLYFARGRRLRSYLRGEVQPIAPEFVGRPKPPSRRTSIPSEHRKAVLNRAVCAYCGDRTGPFHIDHITPVSRGGGNDIKNLACACAPCNMSKGARPLKEWSGRNV